MDLNVDPYVTCKVGTFPGFCGFDYVPYAPPAYRPHILFFAFAGFDRADLSVTWLFYYS